MCGEPLLTENTRFWVVKPRLFAGSISGLDTLLSGPTSEMAPAITATGERTRHFTGLEDPPLLTAEEPGRSVLLRADLDRPDQPGLADLLPRTCLIR